MPGHLENLLGPAQPPKPPQPPQAAEPQPTPKRRRKPPVATVGGPQASAGTYGGPVTPARDLPPRGPSDEARPDLPYPQPGRLLSRDGF